MPYARKVDRNHAEIASAFRAMGCPVLDLSRVGAGVPDLMVRIAGRNQFIEVKDGAKVASKRRLTAQQRQFADLWATIVVETVQDAISLVQRSREGLGT